MQCNTCNVILNLAYLSLMADLQFVENVLYSSFFEAFSVELLLFIRTVLGFLDTTVDYSRMCRSWCLHVKDVPLFLQY